MHWVPASIEVGIFYPISTQCVCVGSYFWLLWFGAAVCGVACDLLSTHYRVCNRPCQIMYLKTSLYLMTMAVG